MIPERFTETSKLVLALILVSSLLCQCEVASQPEETTECPTQESKDGGGRSQCGQLVSIEEHDEEEGLSLMQVGAKRLQGAPVAQDSTGTKQSPTTISTAASTDKEAPASANALVALQVVETATRAKARVSDAVGYGVQTVRALVQTRSSSTLAIVIVAVVGLVALCLLVVAMQPGNTTRDTQIQGSISQNFPRAHSGPYSRQGVPGGSYYSTPDPSKLPGYNPYGSGIGDARPSMYARDSLQASPSNYLSGQDLAHQRADRDGRPLPRVSTTSRNTSNPSIMPRVQAPGSRAPSRPGTGLGLTPAHSIVPGQKDADQGYAGAMAPAPELRPPEVTGFAPRRPPPLCPMLVLPHCESFFAVPIDQLVAGVNTVEILGLSGNALLRATVKDSDQGRVIEVSMSPPRSPPLASICEAASYGSRAGMKELKGSRGKHYGWLRPGGTGHVLRCGEDDVMTVSTNASSGQCQLYAGSNGDMLAQASRSGDGEGIFAAEDLEVRVTPGMDAVLALLCVVSAVLFEHGASAFMFPPAKSSANA